MIVSSLFNITPADWAGLLAGAAAFGGFIFGVVKYLIARHGQEVIKEIDLNYFTLLKSHLKSMAEKAGPENVRLIDINFVGPPANPLRIPLIRDTWVTVLPGCDIMGDEFSLDRTTYYMRTSGATRIRRHTHSGEEAVFVVKGEMTDMVSGKIYCPGQTWVIPSGEVHAALFEAPEDGHGMFLISVVPPLPDLTHATILLDGLHGMIP